MTATSILLQSNQWAQGLVDENQLYLYTAVLMGVATFWFLLWTVRLKPSHRRFGLLAAYITFASCVTYVGMSQGLLRYENVDGAMVPVTRFVGYIFSIGVVLLATGYVGGLSRKLRVALLVAFAMITGGTVGGWFVDGSAGSLAGLSTLLSFPLITYLFLRPGTRAAAKTTPDRKLLYGKLANVTLLAWLGYLVVGIVSRQNLGLLDGFVGVFLGAYLDVIIHVGFGVLLLRHTDALDMLTSDGADEGSEKPVSE